MSNLIKCKEYYCPIWSDEKNIVEPDQVTDCKEYCCPIARNIVVQPDERGDLLLTAHHGQKSRLFHQQVLRRRPRDLAQVPAVQNCDTRSCSVLQNSSKLLQNCDTRSSSVLLTFEDRERSRAGTSLTRPGLGDSVKARLPGRQSPRCLRFPRSRSGELTSCQGEADIKIYTASTKRKISLPKTKKYVAICYNLPGSVRAACRHSGCPRLQHSEEEMISFVNLLNFFIRNFNFLPIDGYAQVDNRVNHTL